MHSRNDLLQSAAMAALTAMGILYGMSSAGGHDERIDAAAHSQMADSAALELERL